MRFVGGNPLFYFLAGIFLVLLLFLLLLSKNQKYKNIFAETIRGRKLSRSNTGQKRDTFWAKRATFLPTSEAFQKISKLKLLSILPSENVTRWPKRDTFSGSNVFEKWWSVSRFAQT